MMFKQAIALGAAIFLSACTTTQDASRAIQHSWIGRHADEFFSEYGPPLRSYALSDGSTLYTWRGGQTTKVVNLNTQRDAGQSSPLASREHTRSRTTVSHPDANTTVTRTSSTTTRFSIDLPNTLQSAPTHREMQIYCEVQITANPSGVIQNINVTNDTVGARFSMSRCAEVFGTTM